MIIDNQGRVWLIHSSNKNGMDPYNLVSPLVGDFSWDFKKNRVRQTAYWQIELESDRFVCPD